LVEKFFKHKPNDEANAAHYMREPNEVNSKYYLARTKCLLGFSVFALAPAIFPKRLRRSCDVNLDKPMRKLE
jgi:hypothetical protein